MALKKFGCLLSAILTLLFVPVMAYAGETDTANTIQIKENSHKKDTFLIPSEVETTGSITIKLEDTNKKFPKNGVSLAIVQVADVINGQFVLTDEYKNAKVDLNNIQTVKELEEAAKKLQSVQTKQKQVVTTDEAGIASLPELPVGVYLIYAADIAKYDTITSALVSIPTFDEEAGMMDYDIEIYPKHIPISENTTVKPVKTGDDSPFALYTVISVTALLVIAGAGVLYLKKYKNNK